MKPQESYLITCKYCKHPIFSAQEKSHNLTCALYPRQSKSPKPKSSYSQLRSSMEVINKSIPRLQDVSASYNTATFWRPKAVMCHICGKEYGTASIGIHIKACTKLWEERESKKPAKERKDVPIAPEDLPVNVTAKELDRHNKVIYEAYNEKVMAQCPNCLRTFLEDRLQVHLNSCTSENPHKKPPGATVKSNLKLASAPESQNKAEITYKEKAIQRPKTLMCHICGREFGTNSLEIHIKTCTKLWEERESKKPPKERKPLPSAPTEIPSNKSLKNIENHNTIVSEAFASKVMARCPNCLRTFLEDRIEIHLRSCTAENPHKLAPSISKSLEGQDLKTYIQKPELKLYKPISEVIAEKSPSRPKALMCHICGREFGTASLEIHVKTCTKLWEEREAKKPVKERRPVPSAPVDVPIKKTMKNIESHNNIVSESFNNQVMARCPHCLRTFLEDRIEIHLRSCTADNPHKSSAAVGKSLEGRDIKTYTKQVELKTYQPADPNQELINKLACKPKTLMCHICGKEYGSSSLTIHLKTCSKLWEQREMAKPEKDRRPVPSAPQDLPLGKSMKAVHDRNNKVSEAFNSQVMVKCPFCTRTFLEDRIEVHLRSCTSENPHRPPPACRKLNSEVKEYNAPEKIQEHSIKKQKDFYEKSPVRPKAIMCHICGREFGTASIEIHAKSCAKLWEEREAKKDSNQRRSVPEMPVEIPISKTFKAIETHNKIVAEAFYTKVLVECPNCSRTFNEDRLEVHLRSCTAENPHRPPPSRRANF